MLPFLNICDSINSDASLDSRLYQEDVFTVLNPSDDYTFQTKESDPALASFFQLASPSFGLQKEQFLRLTTVDNKNIYIPSIEVVRYFYANTIYLASLVLSARGIGQAYSLYEHNQEEDKHYLNLEETVRYVDRYQLFYFIQKSEYSEMFNSIFFNWSQTGILQAPIPFNPDQMIPLEFNAECRQLGNTNNYLILKIKQSNHLQVELNDKNLSIYHPRKTTKENLSTGDKENIELHRRKVKINKNVDTDAKTDSMISPEYIYDDSLDEVNDWDFSINEEKRDGEDPDCSFKIINHLDEDNQVGLSTNEGLSRSGTAARLEIDRDDLEIIDGPIVNLDGLIEQLTMRGFRIQEQDGIFESTINNKSITDYRAQSYADPMLSVRRSYKLVTVVSEDDEVFYLLDAQEREPDHYLGGDKSTRPGILVMPAPETENFEEQFVKPLLANIVINGASWFTRKNRTDKLSPIDGIYGYKNKSSSLRHIQNPERFADSILRAVTKLNTKRNAE